MMIFINSSGGDMQQDKLATWLFDNGGPVIRYRLAAMNAAPTSVDINSLRHDLIQDNTVIKWLNNLHSYEYMTEQTKAGRGLGMGGSSSFLHGSKNMNFEVVLPKLGQLGLHSGMPVLDEQTLSWRNFLKQELTNSYNEDYSDDSEFNSKVYAFHDRRLIVASSLALAGYISDESVRKVINSRLDAISSSIKPGSYDIYEDPGSVKVHPAKWKNHIVKRDYLPDGNIRLPFIHDICGFAELYITSNKKTRNKINEVITWLLAPGYQSVGHYAYIRYPSGRGKHVGDNMNFPGYGGTRLEGFSAKSLILRCWQMAHFPIAQEHPWFKDTVSYLESFVTKSGTYIFPAHYLTEISDGGKWSYGLHMGLGENRRSAKWNEIESTFWIFAIRQLLSKHDGQVN